MDQVKIGNFIQETRKEQSLTQKELAEKLNISDKTVSKWETGNGLPEVGLMLPLCELLHISVNELLSGKKLDQKQYYEKAEANIMDLLKERAEAKKKIIISIIIALITCVAGYTLIIVSWVIDMPLWVSISLTALGAVIMLVGGALTCVLDRDAGVYECPHCGERFVPTMKEYILSTHTPTKRKLKCPNCGKRGYCKKRLSKD